MQTKFNQLFALRPELTRWVAVILPDEEYALFARLDVRVHELLVATNYPVHWEIFTTQKQAKHWLGQHT